MSVERRELSQAEREDTYYRLVAGLAGSRLLESVLDLGLFPLFAQRGAMTADEIVAVLALHPKRARKWLVTLRHMGLVEEVPGEDGAAVRYQSGALARAIFKPDGSMEWFHRDFLRFTRAVFDFDMAQVLRGLPVPQVPYPPQQLEEAEALESWMRVGAVETAETIERAVSLDGVERLLDVAGGDGTMAVHYARRHPRMHITLFNLPNSAFMARQNVARAGVGERIAVVDGDFRRDPLPQGFQLVQFSRVLADWPENTCRTLLEKAWRSLVPGGRLVICEPLADDNPDLAIAFEFGYIPHDDFGIELYKPFATYERLLQQTRFTLVHAARKTRDSIHSVIVAQRA